MKNILMVLVCLTAAMNSFAAPVKKKKVTTTTNTTKSENRSGNNYVAPTHTYDTSGDRLRLGAGGALGMIDGHFAFGVTLRGDYPVHIDSNVFKLGAETGFYHAGWTDSVLTFSYSLSINAIPIAATAQYDFRLANSDIAPYIRAALGLDILFGSVATGLGTTRSETNVKFHGIVEPGIEFGDSNNLFAALPFGAMGGGFFLMPTFGIHF